MSPPKSLPKLGLINQLQIIIEQLTIIAKSSILGFWEGSEYAFVGEYTFISIRFHPFSTYAKSFIKLTFPTHWYAHVRVRFRGQEMFNFFGKLCVGTKWMIPCHLSHACCYFRNTFWSKRKNFALHKKLSLPLRISGFLRFFLCNVYITV